MTQSCEKADDKAMREAVADAGLAINAVNTHKVFVKIHVPNHNKRVHRNERQFNDQQERPGIAHEGVSEEGFQHDTALHRHEEVEREPERRQKDPKEGEELQQQRVGHGHVRWEVNPAFLPHDQPLHKGKKGPSLGRPQSRGGVVEGVLRRG